MGRSGVGDRVYTNLASPAGILVFLPQLQINAKQGSTYKLFHCILRILGRMKNWKINGSKSFLNILELQTTDYIWTII